MAPEFKQLNLRVDMTLEGFYLYDLDDEHKLLGFYAHLPDHPVDPFVRLNVWPEATGMGFKCRHGDAKLLPPPPTPPSPPSPPSPPPPPSPSSPPPPSPPPPHPLPPIADRDAVERVKYINKRFVDGHASNDLATAGVIVHQFDRTENSNQPWIGCVDDDVNRRRLGIGGRTDSADCMNYGQRMSSSIIYGRMAPEGAGPIPLFDPTTPGIVFRPELSKVLCSYSSDAGSRSRGKDGCDDGVNFCPSKIGKVDGWCDGRPHLPGDLIHMLQGHLHAINCPRCWNEVIISAKWSEDHLPESIEAFFYPVDVSEEQYRYIRTVHRDFLEFYGLSDLDKPLLEFDASNWQQPFSNSWTDLDAIEKAIAKGWLQSDIGA